MKLLFLDESGDHNLKRISPTYPVFVLGGVIVDRAYVREVVEPRIHAFKMQFFGRDDVILHTVDMTKGRGDYAFLGDPQLRSAFYTQLNALLQDLDYQIVACVVRKPEHVTQHGHNAADPYMYSLHVIVERFCGELGDEVDGGFIYAECRNPGLDRDLMEAWHQLTSNGRGTGFMRSSDISSRIVDFSLKEKRLNVAGLQLADLVITPIGRHVAGVTPNANQVQWTTVEGKLRRMNGRYMGSGLVIRP